MIVQNSYSYIQIGLALRLLRNVGPKDTRDFVLRALHTLKIQLREGNFQVTMAAMDAEWFITMNTSLTDLAEPGSELGESIAHNVQEQARCIETVIFPESSIKRIYVLPSRRFNSDYLLASPQSLLKDGAYEKLATIAQQDIASACRCILFGESTAAAFHILRATESVLKGYYFHHRRQNRLSKPMWGSMLDQLKAKSKNKPPETLLIALDLIRSAYRNPTQHPEATYEIDSAQDLFGVCLDAIGKMAAELQ
jgi:hypothetical protein